MAVQNQREIVSEVLLTLSPKDLVGLPMACKSCPDALWQIVGKPGKPDQVQVRNYCPIMHVFTWSPQVQEEILDCEHLYAEEAEEVEDDEPLPAYLAQRKDEQEPHGGESDHPDDMEE